MPDHLINCDRVPAVLDQGREGACTGYALAAVVNYHLAERNIRRRVSPRMLYEMARRYDEWPGEGYDGSSARGAMKGWVAHGVCPEESWPVHLAGAEHLTPQRATEARGTPGGAYYRVMHRSVRDMHAALNEVGILYATLMVHRGWDPAHFGTPRTVTYVDSGTLRTRAFPVIQRRGAADAGHAIAIVGYTDEGFIIQNSWGPEWGHEGFALLPYEDWLLHATDVWAAQLGVPVAIDLWERGYADSTAGIHRAAETVALADIRPYVVDVGNNGLLSESGTYWTTEADLRRLFEDHVPRQTAGWEKKRVMLYLHGGLNDERAVAKRVVAFRDVCLANRIYPVHVMWESGVMESLRGIVEDLFTDADERAGGVSEWLERFRNNLVEAKDRSFELSVAWAGRKLWDEMKENAQLASHDARGGMSLLIKHAKKAIGRLARPEREVWELHVVGHSAGSIFAAHAMPHFCGIGIRFSTFQLLAPAIRVDDFERLVLPAIKAKNCPRPTLYVLSDQGERDDTVGPYGKSLLYLVSNAFEGRRATPLVGMEHFLNADAKLKQLFAPDGNLVVAGAAPPGAENDEATMASASRSQAHGEFDNDPATMNAVLYRILGRAPVRGFTSRDLAY